MKRRSLILGMAGASLFLQKAVADSAFPLPADRKLSFRVMRHGSDIGRHQVTFDQTGAHLVVRIEATMRIGLGPITFYRYLHQATEIWDGGQFTSLDSTTDKNGTQIMVKARRTGNGVVIETGRAAPLSLPPNTIPFTHWNEAVTRSPLFNPQEGVAVTEKVTRVPPAPITLANGQTATATRFDFAGSATISDWYDENNQWTALNAVAPDGSVLIYEKLI